MLFYLFQSGIRMVWGGTEGEAPAPAGPVTQAGVCLEQEQHKVSLPSLPPEKGRPCWNGVTCRRQRLVSEGLSDVPGQEISSSEKRPLNVSSWSSESSDWSDRYRSFKLIL